MEFTYADISEHISKEHIRELSIFTTTPPKKWVFVEKRPQTLPDINSPGIHQIRLDEDGREVRVDNGGNVEMVVTAMDIKKEGVTIWDLRCLNVAIFLRMLRSKPGDDLMQKHNMPPEQAVLIVNSIETLLLSTKHKETIKRVLDDVFVGMTHHVIHNTTLLSDHWIVNLAASQLPAF